MITLRQRANWRDLDALGHVNNAVYSSWLENAREAWWRAFAGEFERFPFLLARTEIDFRSAVGWGAEVDVRLWVSRVGNSSFDFTYAIEEPGGKRVAEAKTVQVMFDHATGRTVSIDPAMKSRMENFDRK